MNLLEGKNLKKAMCLAAFIFLALISLSFLSLLRQASKSRIRDFNEGWRIKYDNRLYRNVNLLSFRVPGDIKRGEFVTLYNRLPTVMEDGSAVVFPVRLSSVSVVVDNQIIYGYGSKEYSDGEMIGSAVHLIRIPDHSQGKPITILVRAGEDNAFASFSGVILDKTTWGFPDHMNDHIAIVIISVSLIVGGIVFMIVTPFIARKGLNWLRINQTGMLCFTVGVWNLCDINAVQMFSLNYWWNTEMSYLFGILSLLPIMRIISTANEDTGIRKIFQDALFYMNQLLIAIAVVLSLQGKIHLCNLRFFFQVEGVISIIIVFLLEWVKRKEPIKDNPRFREHVMCLLFIALEILRYHVFRNTGIRMDIFRHSFILYGTLFLVVMMTGSYIYELYRSYVRQVEEKALKKLAYTDGLTGLLNRAFCKDRMEELDKGEKDYHMISFDVDGLKEVNDSGGHIMGDKLLITYAQILEKCFSDVGDIIRPGGDEFLVISDDAAEQELMGRLGWLEGFEKAAERNLGFAVSAAYGMAGRKEAPGRTTEEVYNLADRRMYEMKKKRGVR